jgi:hypothetical protein
MLPKCFKYNQEHELEGVLSTVDLDKVAYPSRVEWKVSKTGILKKFARP